MRLTYQDVLNRIKVVAMAHPKIYSADDGRELEFDIKKKHEWPRFFIRTETSPITGGLGSVEVSVNFTFLIMGLVDKDRTDIVDVMGVAHATMLDVLATLNKEQIIRVTDNPILSPLYDYQDTQTSGWQCPIKAYITAGFECYDVPD